MLRVIEKAGTRDEADGRYLDEIAREGARRMLVAALETEVAAYVEANRDERDERGPRPGRPQRQGASRGR